MAAKKKQSAKPDDTRDTPTFEESLAELQQIVNDLEDGSLGLDESMQRFEKGIQLLRRCHRTLEDAEQKIEILTSMNEEGQAETAPFDAAATIDQPEQTAGKRRQSRSENERESGGQRGRRNRTSSRKQTSKGDSDDAPSITPSGSDAAETGPEAADSGDEPPDAGDDPGRSLFE